MDGDVHVGRRDAHLSPAALKCGSGPPERPILALLLA